MLSWLAQLADVLRWARLDADPARARAGQVRGSPGDAPQSSLALVAVTEEAMRISLPLGWLATMAVRKATNSALL